VCITLSGQSTSGLLEVNLAAAGVRTDLSTLPSTVAFRAFTACTRTERNFLHQQVLQAVMDVSSMWSSYFSGSTKQ
jgi:hypothetical protein